MIKKSADFLKKVKNLGQTSDGAIVVTANVVDLYPSIPHKACLETLKKRLDEREMCEITTQDIL